LIVPLNKSGTVGGLKVLLGHGIALYEDKRIDIKHKTDILSYIFLKFFRNYLRWNS
jgi:hypothetical protein